MEPLKQKTSPTKDDAITNTLQRRNKMNQLVRTTMALDLVRRAVGGDIESQGVAVLYNVMNNDPDPLTINDLMRLVGASHGSISRYLRLLGSADDHPRGGKCHELVMCVEDPSDRRRKLVTLSPKGRRLRSALSSLLTHV